MPIPYQTSAHEGRTCATATYKGHQIEVKAYSIDNSYPTHVYVTRPSGRMDRMPGPNGTGLGDACKRGVEAAQAHIDKLA